MKNNFNLRYIFFISMVSALGGFLFGYDWVVIGGAKPFYERFFQISQDPNLQGWAMSSALIGCICGAVAAGKFTDSFGRRRALLLAAILFILSAIGTGYANQLSIFILSRLAGGMGIGFASTVSPMYISEVSPAAWRGRLVSLNQLTIVLGILSAQIINYLIAEPVPAGFTDMDIMGSWNGQTAWRWMFWVETFPALIFLTGIFLIPESARWLYKSGRDQQGYDVLCRLGGKEYADREMILIKSTLGNENPSVNNKDLMNPGLRRILLIGIFLAVFQQWSGINVIFNYAEEIFTSAGFTINDMLFNVVLTGVVNLIFTFIAIGLVDRLGRKKLMLTGAAGLSLIYIFLGIFYQLQLQGVIVLLLVVSAIALYAMTLAPVTWVIISEIFPNRIRGVAMSIATFSLWTACFILTYTFPWLNKLLNTGGTFWLYGGICLAGFFLIRKWLPETKGKSLEDIENEMIPG
ncbi:MAG: sugar porter family MFS transporter [Cyclobacteriaceae bacterium]|nr:sugar porter family MFS transporter [Cyclobacteriaceae bacterium]